MKQQQQQQQQQQQARTKWAEITYGKKTSGSGGVGDQADPESGVLTIGVDMMHRSTGIERRQRLRRSQRLADKEKGDCVVKGVKGVQTAAGGETHRTHCGGGHTREALPQWRRGEERIARQ